MGNYTSCFFLMHSKPKTAKLMDCQGNLRQVKVPLKAAELMLEEPGHVISPVQELRRASHVFAMRAEDELLAGKLYLLVPLSRVHCKISESEMGVINSFTADCEKKRSRKKRRGAKVLPAVAVEYRDDGKGEVRVLGGKDSGFAGDQSGIRRRHWTPVLEPISEEF